jgi:hypothetical protein
MSLQDLPAKAPVEMKEKEGRPSESSDSESESVSEGEVVMYTTYKLVETLHICTQSLPNTSTFCASRII